MASGTQEHILKHKWRPEHVFFNFKTQMAFGTQKNNMLKHKWHPEHRKCLFLNIDLNGIWNIENVYVKAYMASGAYKKLMSKHKWHPEHRKCLF